MKINRKISRFLEAKKISNKEAAESYGTSPQSMSNILNKENGKVPFDLIIWLARKHPELDMNDLLREENDTYIICENKTSYEKIPVSKDEILKEMSKILDKYFEK